MSALPPDHQIDAARLPVMLSTLRLPSIGRHWEGFASRADLEGWGAARYLAALCEHELADRAARRIARHLSEAGLPRGKTFATFEFAAVPTVRKAHLMALGEGDAWLDQGANILCFGPSGTGKTQVSIAAGFDATGKTEEFFSFDSVIADGPGSRHVGNRAKVRRGPGRFGLRRP